jgi:type VI protein secretion system component Hcp
MVATAIERVSANQEGTTMADFYAFLQLEGIPGESKDSAYQDQLEIQGYSLGTSNNSSFGAGSTGPGVGIGTYTDISCSYFKDKACANLRKYCITGQTIPSGKLTLLKMSGGNKQEYEVFSFTNMVVTSVQESGNGGGDLPMVSFSLHFVQIRDEYKVQANDGSLQDTVDFNWDIQQSAEV